MTEWALSLTANPFFGLSVSIGAFALGLYISKKIKNPAANPLLIAGALLIILLSVLHIPLENYKQGGDLITMLLPPATASLAVAVYRQVQVLKKHFLPVLLGCLAGAATSIGSAYLLCKAFRLDDSLIISLLPKSVTTPIAAELSQQGGGIAAITAAAVVVTGILGAVSAPLLIKLFRVSDPAVQGLAIGACSHAVGTSKAVELGEIQGAMSGIAIGVSGVITVVILQFFL